MLSYVSEASIRAENIEEYESVTISYSEYRNARKTCGRPELSSLPKPTVCVEGLALPSSRTAPPVHSPSVLELRSKRHRQLQRRTGAFKQASFPAELTGIIARIQYHARLLEKP